MCYIIKLKVTIVGFLYLKLEVIGMFNVGDLAVYPAHGVGLVEGIEEKSISGIEHIFYVIRILENDMKIMIPRKNAENIGLRRVISGNEVEQVYTILEKKDVEFTPQTWNRRYREYMDKIKTGSIFDLAAVLRDLYILQMDKPLSFGEKKMLDTAKSLLVKELSVAKDKREEEITEEIESIFNNVSTEIAIEV
jgi:CarD family transcriptional regulator